ncbi:hypothetical protein [Oribacterium sp. C9]|uniref:hypothetical protein n=1 Tax=Oribacterium sp. C9 TaxID=1943579 RepID=UPI0011159975|nr:hypothetical protein [Oribacterium sp. C9]
MPRDDVHGLFKEKWTEFKKTKYSKNTTDNYGKFHVYYTPDNLVEAVEIFEGIELSLYNNIIFPIKVCEIENRISGIEKNGLSYIHKAKSIGIEANKEVAENILVGAEDYFS